MIKRIAWNTWHGDDALGSESQSSDSGSSRSTGADSVVESSETDADEQTALENLSGLYAEQYHSERAQRPAKDSRTMKPQERVGDKVVTSSTCSEPATVTSKGGSSNETCPDANSRAMLTIISTGRAVPKRTVSEENIDEGNDRAPTLPLGIQKRRGETFLCEVCTRMVLLNAKDMLDHSCSKRHMRRLQRKYGAHTTGRVIESLDRS